MTEFADIFSKKQRSEVKSLIRSREIRDMEIEWAVAAWDAVV
ncbi:MAG: hypothetical protein WCN98_18595 [Verrucomicrobiaceae bacterium]